MRNKKKDIKLYSFDIFDTLVTRLVATPYGIFALVQKEIENMNFPTFLKSNFYEIRLGAERFARKNSYSISKKQEIDFDEIYNFIKRNYNLTLEQTELLKKIEINTEIKNLIPIHTNLNKLKDLIYQNKKVLLISDMYYRTEILRKILTTVDPIFKNLKIYSSANFKTSKQEGNLYKIVQYDEDIKFKNWLHIGDNISSDIKQAKKLGINTQHFKPYQLKKFHNDLIKSNEKNVDYQLISGAIKNCNINLMTDKKKEAYRFGVEIGGPILYNYVIWILEQAISSNIKTLYFIARDGYVTKLIADIIIQKEKLDIKTKYIYGSRKAWRIPTESSFEGYIDALFSEFKNELNPEFISYRIGIETSKLCKILELNKNTKKFNKKTRTKLLDRIKNSEVIKDFFLNEVRNKKELLKKYFEQELDFNENIFAFVDLQGSGKTQDYILEIINEIKPSNIITFYYQLNPKVQQKNNSEKIAYNIDFEPRGHWIEILGRSFDGQTLGYREYSNKILPILEEGYQELALNWGVEEYLQGVIDYCHTIIKAYKINKCSPEECLEIHQKYSKYITKNLDKYTADTFGDVPWTAIGKESNNIKTAPQISFIKALLNFILGKRPTCDFPFITIARSSNITKKILHLQGKYISLRKFLIDLYFHKSKKIAYFRIMGIKISFGNYIW